MAALAVPVQKTVTQIAGDTPGYRALRESAAWIDRSARGRIRMTGEDRVRLLHAMSTNHIEALRPGEGCYTFFLNAQGRILADARVACFEDHLLLDTEPELRALLYEHLDRYIIADDVTLEDVTDQTEEAELVGPAAAEALAASGAELPEALWTQVAWGDGFVQRTPAGFALVFPQGAAPRLQKAEPANERDARIVRLEQGRARYGEDITDRQLIQETGLMHAVHFSKGCYLGQEIVERVRSRGQVHRLLRSIEIDTDAPPASGTKLTDPQGADSGEITSAAYSPAMRATVALAYIRTPLAETGTQLRVDGAEAKVRGPAVA